MSKLATCLSYDLSLSEVDTLSATKNTSPQLQTATLAVRRSYVTSK